MRSILVPGLFAVLIALPACSDDEDDGAGGSGNTGNTTSSSSGDGGSGAAGGSPAGTGGGSDGGAGVGGGTGGSADGGAGVGGTGGAGQGGAGGGFSAFGDDCTPDPDTCPAPLSCFGFGMQGNEFHCTFECDMPSDCEPYANVCNKDGYCKAN
jgi:hypothetical protein